MTTLKNINPYKFVLLVNILILTGCFPPEVVEVTQIVTEYINKEVTRTVPVTREIPVTREVFVTPQSPLNYNYDSLNNLNENEIIYNQLYPGTLEPHDNNYQDEWHFKGDVGDQVLIKLIGGSLIDPVLELTDSEGISLALNDDLNAGDFEISSIFQINQFDSLIFFTLPKSDVFKILVRGIGNSGGTYVLSLEKTSPIETASKSPLNYDFDSLDNSAENEVFYNQFYPGTLKPFEDLFTYDYDEKINYYDEWHFKGVEKDQVIISLIGASLRDPILYLEDSEGNSIASNDDYLPLTSKRNSIYQTGELDSLISITLPKTDKYRIIVRDYHYRENAGGTYLLGLEKVKSFQPKGLLFGQVVFSQSNESSLHSGTWSFSAEEGEIIHLKLIGVINNSNYQDLISLFGTGESDFIPYQDIFKSNDFLTLTYELDCSSCSGNFNLQISELSHPFVMCLEKTIYNELEELNVCDFD